MTQRLVLVVDDQEDNRVVFSAILTHYRYNVLIAANGQEAVVQAKRHAPDLIVMDLHMPVMDGWEATRLLKADPATASIPIIAVTAQDHASDCFQEGGFCAYVRKPIAPRDLVKALELCLEGLSRQKWWIDLPSIGSPVLPGQ